MTRAQKPTLTRKQKIAHLYNVINQNFEELSTLLQQQEDEPAPKEKKKKNKDPRKPKRPVCGYAYFTQEQTEAAKEELGMNPRMTSVVTLCAKKWKALTPKQKEPYERLARASREQYHKELKIYNQIIKKEKEATGESSKSAKQENNKKEEANKAATTTKKHVSFKDDQNVENSSDEETEESSEEND